MALLEPYWKKGKEVKLWDIKWKENATQVTENSDFSVVLLSSSLMFGSFRPSLVIFLSVTNILCQKPLIDDRFLNN